MTEIPIRTYGTAVVLIRKGSTNDLFLLLKRKHAPAGAWTYVAGKIEPGETAVQAAIRETAEETGLTIKTLSSADLCEQFYETDNDSLWIAPVFVGFVAEESEVTLNDEHSEYRWCTVEECMELLTFPGTRRIVETIHQDFLVESPCPYLKIEL